MTTLNRVETEFEKRRGLIAYVALGNDVPNGIFIFTAFASKKKTKQKTSKKKKNNKDPSPASTMTRSCYLAFEFLALLLFLSFRLSLFRILAKT